jgi:hypothetical protein
MTVSCSPQGQQQLSVQLKMMEKSEQVTLNTTEMKFTAVHRAAFWTVAVGSPAFSPRSEFTTFIEGNIGGGKVFFFRNRKMEAHYQSHDQACQGGLEIFFSRTCLARVSFRTRVWKI